MINNCFLEARVLSGNQSDLRTGGSALILPKRLNKLMPCCSLASPLPGPQSGVEEDPSTPMTELQTEIMSM
jgi:hypothetical protein